ncbi:MAG: 4-hydroxybenzoate octaprenyltransferase [Dongiaceae bacterium]
MITATKESPILLQLKAKIKAFSQLIRLPRQIGTWLLLIPCWWGVLLAFAQNPSAYSLELVGKYMALFAIGAFLMRSSGCAFNDWVDKDLDGKVERTQNRPLAARALSSGEAWGAMAVLAALALIILLQFNPFTIALGILSLPLVFIYPFMKRISWWPQAFLGLVFNWGALMGYAALTGELSATTLPLYAAGIAWTLGYDTIYAHQDKKDDLLIGIRSSALRLGARTKPFLFLIYSLVIVLLAAVFYLSGFSPLAYLGLLPAAAHFWRQARQIDIENPASCAKFFSTNREAGLLIAAAIAFAPLW